MDFLYGILICTICISRIVSGFAMGFISGRLLALWSSDRNHSEIAQLGPYLAIAVITNIVCTLIAEHILRGEDE